MDNKQVNNGFSDNESIFKERRQPQGHMQQKVQQHRPLTEEEIKRRQAMMRRQQALRNNPSASSAQPQRQQSAQPRVAVPSQNRSVNGTGLQSQQRTTANRTVQRTPAISGGQAQVNRQQPVQNSAQKQVKTPAQAPVQRQPQRVQNIPAKPVVNTSDEDVDEIIPTGRKGIKKAQSQEKPLFGVPQNKNRQVSNKPKIEKSAPVKKATEQQQANDNKFATTKNDKKKGSAKSGADVMISITKAAVYLVIVVAISVFLSVIAIRVGNDVFAFVKSDDEITITIPEDATVSDVASILGDNGIVNYPSIFKIYCSIKHEKGDFVAGDYTVSPNMSYDKLRYEFKEQPVTGTSWITIPEGYTVDDIIDLLVENGIGTREKYIDVINNYDFDFWFIDELNEKGISNDRSYRLEGYLFPDTYEFYNSSSEETVINKLLKRFDEVYVKDYKAKADELGYSTDEILTIASYIQKEAKNASDYLYVSSVIHNRLNNSNFQHLELDATIIYAIRIDTGEKKTSVSHDDTLYVSPYNSYTCVGLTPGPITNPGASAIRYALYPAESNYYYYVSDNNGTIYYAKTKEEHNNNIELVRSINEDS